VKRIEKEQKAQRSVVEIIGKIMGLISFIFGGLGIIGVITLLAWPNEFVFLLSFSVFAVILGIFTYLVGKEKRFSLLGIILGAITWVILIIIVISIFSAPGF